MLQRVDRQKNSSVASPAPSVRKPSGLSLALKDLGNGWKRQQLWRTLAVEDIRSRYMRSFGGMIWVFVSFAFFVFVKTIIFAPLFGKEVAHFAPYVTTGYFVWAFVSSSISEGCNSFISAKGWIRGARLPLSVFVYRTVTRNMILTCINALVVVIILLITKVKVTPVAFFVVPMAGLFFLNALWVTILFSIIGARFRDFIHMVSTVMRVMLFLTPIFWMPEQMGKLWNYLQFNPIAHFLIAFRDPLIYGTIPELSVKVVLGITVAGWVLALATFSYARHRIVFWI
ncbi:MULTISPECIES: ABC transporter permease [Hyphomonas]|jgi:ABC-type polysaccharide/polyol phosphate export permease|uniref:ABC transporter permease n=1 Tax=Hyphomonas TaxID=85 RepID=UPI003511F3FF